ncbi:MAG: ABC transporter permease subunit [Syntrophomonadaceae bacterium]
MNIYRQENRMNLPAMLYWTLGMLLGLLFFMLMFPAISKDAVVITEVTKQFPPAVIRALGLNTLDLSTVLGFYSYVFVFILLVGAIYALKSGISTLSEEIRAKTADFLVSKPVRRTEIAAAKALSVVTLILLQTIIYVPLAFVVTKLTTQQDFDGRIFLAINLTLMLLQLFFVALGLLLAVVIKRIRNVLSIALGTVFALWVVQMLNQTLADPALAYLTPFAYFDLAGIIASGGYQANYLVADIILIITFAALAGFIYQRQDMPSV